MLKLDINLLFTVINLLILYFIVQKFLFKPVQKVLDARKAEIAKQYADAREAQDTAEGLKQQYEASARELDDGRERILEEAREKAGQEYDKILEEARAQADKILEDARKDADVEQQRRRQQTQEEIADLVMTATAKLVASKQNAEADRALYDQFIAKTGEKA